MLGHLIRKEILDHILSLRFLMLSAVGALIIWLSLFSGYGYYQERLREYRLAQAMTYDSVCGEKEAGTLRLLASFSVPRDRLLMGKLIGALIPTLTVFGLSLTLGIAGVFAMPDIQFTGSELARLGWTLVACGLYLTAFTCIGIFASCLARQAATSFVLLLGFWALSVAVLPSLSLIAADALRPAPSVHEYQAELSRLNMENLEKRRHLRSQWQKEHSRPGEEWWKTPQGQEAFWLYYTRSRDVTEESAKPLRARVEESFRNRYKARLDLAVLLARFSPAFALKNALVRLAGAGLDRQRRFEEVYRQHKERNEAWYRGASERSRLRQVYPAKYGKPQWDVSDMPRFAYRETWPGGDVQTALMDVGMLILWGALFFLGAYVAILRYDLR
ncbi:MAG: hypothetical protein A3F84_14370 [Candidatus Handelsmanbacteria bacterium RIFCSPLOWO2_12_FULL_64_10]|uniref:ABC transporter permease n=1 Tax=Handelsmanbacteria sp. (strain RIFCSPLOWO2_12_FULL_64_10) TaxID=1817868 RepID=A0A1F6CJ20_HANXR|nr:MAG: hypothetical protein A3F84_14370 [Candidatus Handelsmanbacteria bacterium RIFCSPLOWO2_12_FULL_64_10]